MKINIETWPRKQTFLFYENLDVPMYTMTFDLDVTRFYHRIKQQKQSFYFTFMHLVMRNMHAIENFRYRFVDDEPYLFDFIHPSFTDAIEGSDQFKIVTVDYREDLTSFIQHAKQQSDVQGSQFIDLSHEVRQDLVYITTFPWARYTQVSHAYNINPHDAIPRVVWGKFEEINGRKIMPFSISVHHAFVDGRHVGLFINQLQEQMNVE